MTAPLTVHNAEIKTAAVEVRTLTISGKQVTLAVFRQLREEELLTDDGLSLKGVPWGTVNYHPDKCASDGEHLHVVWQRGAELHRSRIDAPWKEFASYERNEIPGINQYTQAAFCSNGHKAPEWMDTRFAYWVFATIDDVRCRAIRPVRHPPNCPRVNDRSPEIPDAVATYVASMRRFQDAYNAHWKALSDLPQLFIAV